MRTIALFLPNWIGDVVMATPAIRAVREHYPDAKLLAVCKPYVADTIKGSPWFDDTVLFDKRGTHNRRFWNVIRLLRDEKTDTAVLFPNSFRAALMARLAGCHTVVGYARYFRDCLLTHRLYPTRDGKGKPKPVPVIDDYNRIVERLGVPDPGHQMELFTTTTDELAAEQVWQRFGLMRFSRIIGLNPGGAFGSSKHWPTNYFSELAQKLTDKHGAAVVVLCGPTEREVAKQIVEQSNRTNVFALNDIPLSVGLTKAMVRRLSMLITTDSGPRHFAAAFDVPVVTLFGPTHIAWTETYFDKAIHIQKAVPCGPCQQRVCPLGHHRCMTELTPTEVMQSANQLLRTFTEEVTQERRHAS